MEHRAGRQVLRLPAADIRPNPAQPRRFFDEAALRELREETGIVATDLTQVGTVIDPEIQRAIYVEFLCVTDWDKEAVTLQEGETVDFRWVSREELLGMKEDQLVTRRMQQFIDELNRP